MKMKIQDEESQTPAHNAFYGGNFESIEKQFIVTIVLYKYILSCCCLYKQLSDDNHRKVQDK